MTQDYGEARVKVVTYLRTRRNTKTGRPCGDEVFMEKIENLLGRKLNALPKGSPRRRE